MSDEPGRPALDGLAQAAQVLAVGTGESQLHAATEHIARSPSTDVLVERGELRGVVHDAVMSLPVAQRRAVALAHLGGLTHAEVAVVTGDPLGTVKSRLRLGHGKLRAALVDLAQSNV